MAFLSIFVFGPAVLAGFWWRSMPKHDELLTVAACGLPLFVALVAGDESWRALGRGTQATRQWTNKRRAGWAMLFCGIATIGYQTAEGWGTDGGLVRAQLQNVVFVETPQDWLPRDEAEQV